MHGVTLGCTMARRAQERYTKPSRSDGLVLKTRQNRGKTCIFTLSAVNRKEHHWL